MYADTEHHGPFGPTLKGPIKFIPNIMIGPQTRFYEIANLFLFGHLFLEPVKKKKGVLFCVN